MVCVIHLKCLPKQSWSIRKWKGFRHRKTYLSARLSIWRLQQSPICMYGLSFSNFAWWHSRGSLGFVKQRELNKPYRKCWFPHWLCTCFSLCYYIHWRIMYEEFRNDLNELYRHGLIATYAPHIANWYYEHIIWM